MKQNLIKLKKYIYSFSNKYVINYVIIQIQKNLLYILN